MVSFSEGKKDALFGREKGSANRLVEVDKMQLQRLNPEATLFTLK